MSENVLRSQACMHQAGFAFLLSSRSVNLSPLAWATFLARQLDVVPSSKTVSRGAIRSLPVDGGPFVVSYSRPAPLAQLSTYSTASDRRNRWTILSHGLHELQNCAARTATQSRLSLPAQIRVSPVKPSSPSYNSRLQMPQSTDSLLSARR